MLNESHIGFRIRLLIAILSMVATAATPAQLPVPTAVHYQFQLPVGDDPQQVEIAIYGQSAGGEALWGKAIFTQAIPLHGVFSLLLDVDSEGRSVSDAFATGDCYIEIAYGEAGSSATTTLPRLRMVSAPFALAAGGIPGVTADTKLTLEGLPGHAADLRALGSNGHDIATLGADESNGGGLLTLRDQNSQVRLIMGHQDAAGYVRTFGASGGVAAQLGAGSALDRGRLGVYRAGDMLAAEALVEDADAGVFNVYGPNGNLNHQIIRNSADPNSGGLLTMNQAGAVRARIDAQSNGVGAIATYGPNGNYNVRATSAGSTNHGYLAVYDANGSSQASLSINGAGNGVVSADSKNFMIDHPSRPGYQLVHTSIEGPEIAVIYRGSGRLEKGEATVRLPEYFEALTRSEGRTIQLSPTRGWAPLFVAEPIIDGTFRVATTPGGDPMAHFDWEVKAVRADLDPLEIERLLPKDLSDLLPGS